MLFDLNSFLIIYKGSKPIFIIAFRYFNYCSPEKIKLWNSEPFYLKYGCFF
jgi:hypothetical protein